jgi:chromosome segregation ATPase
MTLDSYDQVYTLDRFKLEKECIYLMKKREVLEKVIARHEETIKELVRLCDERDKMLEQRSSQISGQTTSINQILTNVNREKEELSQEVQRLQRENKELRAGVVVD